MTDAAEQLQRILDGDEARRRWGARIRLAAIWITGLFGAPSLAYGLAGDPDRAAGGAILLFICARLWRAEDRDYY